MSEQVLKVPDVMCDHCITAIEGAVGALGGVERVKVDLERKAVDVSFDEAETSLEEIVGAINGEGYDVEGHGEAAGGDSLLQIGRQDDR